VITYRATLDVPRELAPDGLPLLVSEAEPGSVHDITAARLHALPALYRAAAADLRTLADSGYEGAASRSSGRPAAPCLQAHIRCAMPLS
jgi:hypothetical protein